MLLNIRKSCAIVIPSRERDKILQESLNQLRCLYPNVNVILILDESCQNDNYDNVFYLKSSQNTMSVKRNEGVEFVDKNFPDVNYIAFIDSDAFPNTNWLENGIGFLEKNPDYTAVTGAQYPPDTDNIWQKLNRLVRYAPLFAGSDFREIINKKAFSKDVKDASSSNFIIRKIDFLALGGFDKDIYIAEDNDFCQRLNNQSKKIRFIPDVSVFHRQRNLSAFLKGIYAMGRYYLSKDNKNKTLFQLAPLTVFIFLLLLLFFKQFLLGFGLILVAFIFLLIQTIFLFRQLDIKKSISKKIIYFIYIYFVSIGFICSYLIGSIFAIFNIPPNSYETYKH
jgi:GT2 family glycosyltransferase